MSLQSRIAAVCLISFLYFCPSLHSAPAQPFPGPSSYYHGFPCHEIALPDKTVARVLVPKFSISTRPWILVPQFYPLEDPKFGNLAQTQVLLLNKGFHLVAAPSAAWDSTYGAMTQTYGLCQEVAFMGADREVMDIVRWVLANPDKVSAMYFDKGVFAFTQEFSPEKLAATRVPALCVAGDKDEVAPVAEHAELLLKAYYKAGYDFRLIKNKNQGHEPYGLSNNQEIFQFIYGESYRAVLPTQKAVSYGPHPRQFLDFYQAKSSSPTPVVIYIHGGSWEGSSLMDVSDVREYLKQGISVVSIEYRFVRHAVEEKIVPPVRGPLTDAARAVQFVRSKAGEWNLRKDRVALTGFSAGACSSLWLAFHPDLADPSNPDPVLRESTRPTCIAISGAQTSLDPKQMREWIPNIRYGAHAFGVKGEDSNDPYSSFNAFLSKREEILPWINEYSPYALAKADAPPVYLGYSQPPDFTNPPQNATHSANFGVKLAERLKDLGVRCELKYPGSPATKPESGEAFVIELLKQ